MATFGSSGNNTEPPLCANDCGFYGSMETRNLCSKCYAAFLKQRIHQHSQQWEDAFEALKLESGHSVVGIHRIPQQDPVATKSESKSSAPSESAGVGHLATKSSSLPELASESAGATKTRCMICKKKTGVVAFNCRCGGLFCCKHRFPDKHCCSVDQKAIDKVKHANEMVECKGDKLPCRI